MGSSDPRALACLVPRDSELASLLRSLIKRFPPPPPSSVEDEASINLFKGVEKGGDGGGTLDIEVTFRHSWDVTDFGLTSIIDRRHFWSWQRTCASPVVPRNIHTVFHCGMFF